MTDIIEDRGRGFIIEIGEKLSRLRAELAQRTANRDALAAEVAALKANDPLAEMWRELAEYQPIADLDGHGESWAKMCRERTEDAARAAMEDDAARSAAGYAAAAASGASGASMWARLSIALIRRAKEVQR
jgi:hypothetical protein